MALTTIDDRGLKTPIDLLDNEKIRFGTGNDLEVFHDGSHSKVANSTGYLVLKSNQFSFANGDESHAYIKVPTNEGGVELYYDNSKKFETYNYGIKTTGHVWLSRDNDKAYFGAGSDLEIYHNGTDSFIKNTTGNLQLTCDEFRVKSNTGTEAIIQASVNGDVQLFYDGAKKLETTSGGVQVLNGTGDAQLNIRGGSSDGRATLQFVSDDSAANSDNFRLRNDANNDFYLQNYSSGSWETNIKANGDGSVDLYHNNFKSFNTTDTGIHVWGPEGTAAQIYMYADDGDDNADKWRIQVQTDGIWGLENYAAGGWEANIKATGNGAVELYYDNSKKFETRSGGCWIGGNLEIEDSNKVSLGTSDDLALYHDGSHSYIRNDTGILHIRGQGSGIRLQKSDGEPMIYAIPDGAVELYHDGSKQFQTHSNGLLLNGGAKITRSANSNDPLIEITNSQYAKSLWIGGWDSSNTAGVSRIRNSNDNLHLDSGADGQLYLNHYAAGQIISKAIEPMDNDTYDLGTSSKKWDDVYATNGSIQTSDRTQKNTIVDSDLGLSFVNKLKPVSYKFNNKTRTHYGLIAQDVETVLSDISKPTTGFAGFIKEAIPDIVYKEAEANIPEGKKAGDLKVAAHTEYGLRYGEFISPLIKAVQELSAEVEILKTEVAALKAK